MNAAQEILVYLVQALSSLLLIAIVLRGVLHAARADFYNPITQFVVRFTNPMLNPVRRMIPLSGRVDPATLLLAVLIQLLGMAAVLWLSGYMPPNVLVLLLWSLVGVTSLVVSLYFVAIIIMIILSWVAPGSQHPAIYLIYQIVDPVMAPFRSLIPSMGGLDFSALFVILALNVLKILIRHAAVSVGLPAGLVIGL